MPGLFDEYVEGGAREIFGGHPSRREDRLRAVRLAERPLDEAVAAALRAQHRLLPPSAPRAANLLALDRGAAAVVTGQQAGLFLGPLYTIYKAATAIRVARALAEESGRPVVPVFWLQVEDHDLPEIAEIRVAGPPGRPAIRLSLPASAASRISVAHLRLPEAVEPLIEELRAALVPLPHAAEHVDTVRRHWRAGATWAEAFGGMIAELFGPEGLIVVQPRDEALAACASGVHRQALEQAAELEALLLKRSRLLRDSGHVETVRVRPGSPLSFFHQDGAEGSRHRLERCDGGFREIGGTRTLSLEELLARLQRDPLAFSSSALLRPIVQDRLLPTAAYVGGPGEVAYLAQVPPLHEAFGIPSPLVVPRARFRIVDDGLARILGRLGLTAAEVADAASDDALLARCRPADDGADPAIADRLMTPFRAALAELRPRLEQAGQGLDKAAERAEAAVAEAVGKLAGKHERALLHRDERLVEDVRRVRQALLPDEKPQERVLGMSSFAARDGQRAFIERVLGAVRPFDFAPGDLA